MNDGKLPSLYTKETREYARHVRYLRDVRGSRVSLFSPLSRMHHVTRGCATSEGTPRLAAFAHVKRMTLQVITLSPSWLASSRRFRHKLRHPRSVELDNLRWLLDLFPPNNVWLIPSLRYPDFETKCLSLVPTVRKRALHADVWWMFVPAVAKHATIPI